MLIMLDLDNTLGDRASAVDAWLDEFAEIHRVDDETRRWMADLDGDGYTPRDEVFSQIRDRLDIAATVDELVDAYRTRIIELTTPTPGARDCLVALREAGHKLAIVTNGSSRQQHAKVDRLGFGPLVDAVVVSGDLGIKKPDARIFEIAASRVNGSLDHAWMVGDSPTHDIVGAAELGCSTIWIKRDREWTHPEASPTLTVDTPGEIPGLLP